MVFKNLEHANALDKKQKFDIVTAIDNLKKLTNEATLYSTRVIRKALLSSVLYRARNHLKDLKTMYKNLDRNNFIDVVDYRNDIIHDVERLIHAFFLKTQETTMNTSN